MSGDRPAVTLRPAEEGDRPFMLRVYASTREPELTAAGLSPEQREMLVAQQFEAQTRHYESYPDTTYEVVLVGGEPGGRLIVARWPGELRVVDITLLPEHRGRGFGAALMRRLIEEAEERGAKTSLRVARSNPAQRLYARLGFRQVAADDVHLLLERPPAGQPKTAS